jgi:hypothetical protein
MTLIRFHSLAKSKSALKTLLPALSLLAIGASPMTGAAATGDFKSRFGANGTGNGQFQDPRSIEASPTGDLFIVDDDRDDVQRFDAAGVFQAKFGSSGLGNGQLQSGEGLAVSPNGHILVIDDSRDDVQIFDSSGNFLSKFGSSGGGNGQFQSPDNIAAAPNNNIITVDDSSIGGPNFQIFDSNGSFIKKIVSPSAGPPPATPFSLEGRTIDYTIDFSSNEQTGGNLPLTGSLVVGAGNEFNGAISYSFLSSGFSQTLSGTFTIDVSADAVFVRFQGKGQGGSMTCTLSNLNWNHSGQVTSLGNPVNTGGINGVANHLSPTFTETSVTVGFNPFGFQPGLNMTQQVDINTGTAPAFTLNSPEGCAVAPNGDIYISDNASGNEKILVFDSNGNFISQFGNTGTGPGQLDDPRGIVVAPNGEILVIENDNRRVQVFSASGASLLTFGTADDTAPYGDGSFDDPLDLSLLANGDVAVVDEDRDDVQIFEGKAAWASAIADTTDPVISCSPNLTVNNTPGQCGATVTYSATATDDTDPAPIIACTPPSGSTFAIGTTIVSCTATDLSGNQSSCNFTITVNDTELPTIACPANIIVSNDPGTCGALVIYPTPVGSDNCPGAVTIQSTGLGSGSLFPVGTTTETFVVTDAAGNQTSCSFTVTVNDTELPTIACPANIIVNNDPGICGALVTYLTPVGSDNCPGAVTIQSTGFGSGALFPVGTTTETFVVTDAAGNQTSCSFTVIVNDTELPTIACPANIIVDNDPGLCGALVTYPTPVGSDNCPGAVTIQSTGLGSAALFPVGTTTETFVVTDAAGNQTSCSFTITVNDAELPILSCPVFIEVDAQSPSGATVNFKVMASDNCTSVPSLNTAPASGSLFPIGETTVISTAIDSASNQSECIFIVKVLSPAEMTDNLVESVNNLDIPTGTKNSLLSQLGNALAKIQNGNINGAVGSLNGLINHALAQSGKKLSVEQADSIIAAAQSILAALPAQQANASNKGKKKSVELSKGKFTITRHLEQQLEIEWEHGTLESADSLSGPWLHLPRATSPYLLNTEDSQEFFRLKSTAIPTK